jgi:hypothetical protein
MELKKHMYIAKIMQSVSAEEKTADNLVTYAPQKMLNGW